MDCPEHWTRTSICPERTAKMKPSEYDPLFPFLNSLMPAEFLLPVPVSLAEEHEMRMA
jgi:hypothetical protein